MLGGEQMSDQRMLFPEFTSRRQPQGKGTRRAAGSGVGAHLVAAPKTSFSGDLDDHRFLRMQAVLSLVKNHGGI